MWVAFIFWKSPIIFYLYFISKFWVFQNCFYFVEDGFFNTRARNNATTNEMINVMMAYETNPEVPITAPVIRFSLIIPNAPVRIIIKEVREIETKIARSIPIIIIL